MTKRIAYLTKETQPGPVSLVTLWFTQYPPYWNDRKNCWDTKKKEYDAWDLDEDWAEKYFGVRLIGWTLVMYRISIECIDGKREEGEVYPKGMKD